MSNVAKSLKKDLTMITTWSGWEGCSVCKDNVKNHTYEQWKFCLDHLTIGHVFGDLPAHSEPRKRIRFPR